MDHGYSKYIDDYMKGELKEELKEELLEHAKGCSECSRRIKVIDGFDREVLNSINELPYTSRKDEIVFAARSSKGKIWIESLVCNWRRYVYAAAAVVLILVFALSYKTVRNMQEPLSGTKDPISMVVGIQDKYYNSVFKHKYSCFIIRNGYYYAYTDQIVGEDKIDKLIGRVSRTGHILFLKDGDSDYDTDYYSIIGVSADSAIAVKERYSKSVPAGYAVLTRREPVEIPDTEHIFSAQGEPEACAAVINNLKNYMPYIYTFNTDDLDLYLVFTEKNTNRVNKDGDATGYILMNYVLKDTADKDNGKWIYLRIYEEEYPPDITGSFDHIPDKIVSSFKLNGISWQEYRGNEGKYPYFIGKKDGIVYEVGSLRFTSEEVKKYLDHFN
jgi:hypothetical protein